MRRTSSAPSGASSSMRLIARAIARGSPFRTRSDNESFMMKDSLQELTGDDKPLNLGGAFADREELHVTEVLLRRIVLHESVAAVDLDAFLGYADGRFARVQLRHRG